jgi:hypothetical protein
MKAVARALGIASDDPAAVLEAVNRLAAANKELTTNADYSSWFGDESLGDVTLVLKVKEDDADGDDDDTPAKKKARLDGGGSSVIRSTSSSTSSGRGGEAAAAAAAAAAARLWGQQPWQ